MAAYEFIFAPEAIDDMRSLRAVDRVRAASAIETHLRHEPCLESKSRIKRLRGLRQPQYRLRVSELRVYYDVSGNEVHILAITAKKASYEWLEKNSKPS